MGDAPLRRLASADDVRLALEAPEALLYKHSPICRGSTRARLEIDAFVERNPDVPVFVVDVIGARPVSQHVAERLGVRHESPQAILVRGGNVVWHDSHYGVSATSIEKARVGGA